MSTLTQGQKDAVDAFFDFMLSDAQSFSISGTAGTGKTYLMGYLASKVIEIYRQSCVLIELQPDFDTAVFTATTNKAARVLQATLKQPVSTIHSFLGLKVQEDHQTGETTLSRLNTWRERTRLVVFIDECSMIDRTLYEEIQRALGTCKLVYVGDHSQMAPVGERISSIYEDLEEKHRIILTEPIRNAGQPALMDLCDQLRETVETGIFKPIQHVHGVVHYLDEDDMKEGLKQTFINLDPSCRVLCFTNARAQEYNQFIRQTVRQRPATVQPGDIMVLAQPYARGHVSLSVETEVEVLSATAPYVCQLAKNLISEQIFCRAVAIQEPQEQLPITVLVAEDTAQVNALLKKYAQRKEWPAYFDLKATFADLRDKAACTVYKAQGSTYDAVFVDLENIGSSYDPEQVARMLFVAVSRARNAVYLYGNLPPRYNDSRGKPLWAAKSSAQTSSTPSSNTPISLSSPVDFS